jgi:hypothetical protein
MEDGMRSRTRWLAALAGALALGAVVGWPALNRFFYPPNVVGQEAYAGQDEAVARDCFSHDRFDALLRKHVKTDSGVDYAGLKRDEVELRAYIESQGPADLSKCSRDDILAFYINAYNAATLLLIVERYPGLRSIRDIPANQRWDDVRWDLAGERWSLTQIEHEVLRKRFKEPRLHFAINCASKSCPPLRNEAYVGSRIDAQLQDTAERFNRAGGAVWDRTGRTLRLSKIYDWYLGDFADSTDGLPDVAAKYLGKEVAREILEARASIRVEFQDYDWSLNEAKAK